MATCPPHPAHWGPLPWPRPWPRSRRPDRRAPPRPDTGRCAGSAEPIPAAVIYRRGILVQIPRPERFAIHKLIVSERRRGRDGSLPSLDAKSRSSAAGHLLYLRIA
ncbi:GSU2403 family nucleotidyltransferase fold protein [Oceanibaculum pacificum]|uniref:GSU2403 family nucleotidyltransferase fold protein n=1 Tax=Oceanibaculum pacificum TaxID=580166 RepID=UPI0022B74008|nr:GSU2403 family nucleotidyltransferase fold protein [Oceanibaculum pacificum]